MTTRYLPGQILLARDVPDSRGRNFKTRPVFVYEPFSPGDHLLYVLGISTDERVEPLSDPMPLPYGPPSPRCVSGLREKCWLYCSRLVAIEPEKVERRLGYLHPKQVVEILRSRAELEARLQELSREAKSELDEDDEPATK